MKKDFSPEERLLRLIKGPKKKDIPKKIEINTEHPGDPVQPEVAPSYHKSSQTKVAKSISPSLPFKLREFNIQAVNFLLIIFLLGLLLYFAFDLFNSGSYGKKEVDVASEYEKGVLEANEEDVLAVQPFSYYSSSIGKRNIFMPQEEVSEPVITGPSLEEISTSFSLIGIIAGNRPQAIIEDRKTGKSYFLYKDGTIGQTKVVEILEDSVIMEYQAQRFELVL